MVRFYPLLHFLGINFSAIFLISTKVTHEPHPRNPSKVPFVLSSYLPEKKGLRFRIIFQTTLKYVLSNPESFLFSKNKNGYGKIATTYHTNHLVKNHEKSFWRFKYFSETLVTSNLNKGVLRTLEHEAYDTYLL